MFSLFTRDEAFQVHNDPARVWVFLLPSVESFPFLSEARLRGLLRSAEVCGLSARCVGPRGFWFLVSRVWPSAYTVHCPTAPVCPIPCFPVSCFRVSRANIPRNPARHGSLRCASPSILSTPSRQRHRHRRNQHLARPSNAARQLQFDKTRDKGTHHGAACKRLKTSLASPCHERPRGDGLVQRIPYRRLTLQRRNYE